MAGLIQHFLYDCSNVYSLNCPTVFHLYREILQPSAKVQQSLSLRSASGSLHFHLKLMVILPVSTSCRTNMSVTESIIQIKGSYL